MTREGKSGKVESSTISWEMWRVFAVTERTRGGEMENPYVGE